MNTQHIRAVAQGTADGSSWENAADLTHLDAQCVLAGPGGEVLIRADDRFFMPGNTASPIATISTQVGTAGNRVLIRGAHEDGRPGFPRFIGDRVEPYDNTTGRTDSGRTCLRIRTSHVEFDHLQFERLGAGCMLFDSVVHDDVVVSNIKARNVMRFIWQQGNNAITNGVFRNLDLVGFSKAALRFEGDCQNILIEDFLFDGDLQQGGDDATGIVISGTTGHGNSHFIIRNGEIRNLSDRQSQLIYWQGDGVTSEGPDSDIYIENVRVSNVTDGGFDMKASNVHIKQCHIIGAKRSFRLWNSTQIVEECISEDPVLTGGIGRASHIWAKAGGMKIIKCTLLSKTSTATAYEVDSSSYTPSTGAGASGPLYVEKSRVVQPAGAPLFHTDHDGDYVERDVTHEVAVS